MSTLSQATRTMATIPQATNTVKGSHTALAAVATDETLPLLSGAGWAVNSNDPPALI